MAFNENTRVKIPAIIHMTRLGYEYTSLRNAVWDADTNIFTNVFAESISRINPDIYFNCVTLLADIKNLLDYEDLGRAFYNRILSTSGVKLIDFDNFNNNSFHVCTELPCKNGGDEFRPDITVLINGMPLVFIEVKKPNNSEGILAERNRINMRFQNNKFRRFLNATQFMIFSNNMEYDDDSVVPVQGAFYSSISTTNAAFNCFREEDTSIFDRVDEIKENVEQLILKDNNLVAIKDSDEYITNCGKRRRRKVSTISSAIRRSNWTSPIGATA